MPNIKIIGIAPNSGIEGLPEELKMSIAQCDLLIGGRDLIADIEFPPERKIFITADLEKILTPLKEHPRKKIVILAVGDPNLYGIADFILRNIPKERVEIFPNVSSMQLAFARVKETMNEAVIISLHGRKLNHLIPVVKEHRKIGIFTDPRNTPAIIARELLRNNLKEFTAWLCEDLGLPEEKIREINLPDLAKRRKFSKNILILKKNKSSFASSPEKTLRIGMPDELFFHRGDMITKAEIRAITLSKLSIERNNIIWDVGAGCGSVSVEAGMIAEYGSVFAIERDRRQFGYLKKNIKKFGLSNVIAINGEAPEGLIKLPRPDRIFIGGSGANLPGILSLSLKSLIDTGILVINTVSLESFQEAGIFLKKNKFPFEIITVNISKKREFKQKNIFMAFNPINILIIRKGGRNEKN